MRDDSPGLPLEEFIQAITSQLDRTQEALSLKAQAGMPLTFAVKDLSLDLRTHVDMTGSVVHIRPAGPGEDEASMLHLSLSTITRPMIEENTRATSSAQGETSLKEAFGDDLSEEEERRLEWAGVRSVEQLKALRERRVDSAINRATRLPVDRLFSRLQNAAQPTIRRINRIESSPLRPSLTPRTGTDPDGTDPIGVATMPVQPKKPARLQIRGSNLRSKGRAPIVRIDGAPVEVLEAWDDELIVQPLADQLGGDIEIDTGDGVTAWMPDGQPAGASRQDSNHAYPAAQPADHRADHAATNGSADHDFDTPGQGWSP